MTAELLHERRGPVMLTTLNRPQARNALTFAMYQGLAEMAEEVARDPALRAWVITGAGGKAFAAGTDIGQFTEFRSGADGIAYEERLEACVERIEDCPKPVIAAIAGACTGGGLAIAGVCDLRLGAANARFGMPIAKTLGNCLSMANYARLAALLGPARVKELIFTARLVEAPEALSLGLVSQVLETPEAALDRALELAGAMAAHAPITMAVTKQALKRLRLAGLPEGHDLVERAFGSEDFAEGVRAFLAKRPPDWKGR